MVSFSNSAKKCVSITSFFWLSTSQLPWAMFAGKKKFLGVVIYTLTKDGVEGRRRSCVTVPFSLPTLGVLGRMCCRDYEICCEDFEMYCKDFRICSEFKMCVEEVEICCT